MVGLKMNALEVVVNLSSEPKIIMTSGQKYLLQGVNEFEHVHKTRSNFKGSNESHLARSNEKDGRTFTSTSVPVEIKHADWD